MIIEGDAHTYPVTRYDVIWHDIWTYIDRSNLESMDQLEKRYADFCAWQGCWSKELLLARAEFLPRINKLVRN